MIITVTLNPAIDKTTHINKLIVNELNRLDNVFIDIGGKGINVSKILKILNEDSLCLGYIGGLNGEYIEEQLDKLNIKHDFIKLNQNTRVNIKIIDKDKNLTEINELGPIVNKKDIDKLKNKLKHLLKMNDILILSGSAPKSIAPTIYKELADIASLKGCKIILDADGDLLLNGLKSSVNVIKPNLKEFCDYLNINTNTKEDIIINKASMLLNDNLELIVLSNGDKGSYFITKDKIIIASAISVNVVSSVGAGDAMVSAIAYYLKNNLTLEECVRLSIACASATVERKESEKIKRSTINRLKKIVTYKVISGCIK